MLFTKEICIEFANMIWEQAIKAGGKPGQITSEFIDITVHEHAQAILKKPFPRHDELLFAALYTEIDGLLTLMGLGQWADVGFPQVEMGHKYAAAMLASDINPNLIDHVRPPWKSFFIEVPNDLLYIDRPKDRGDEGPPLVIRRILVFQNIQNSNGPWAWIAWTTEHATLWRFGLTTETLLPPEHDVMNDDDITQHMQDKKMSLELTDIDTRTARLIGRLIVNTCLTMSSPENFEESGKGHQAWKDGRLDPGKMNGRTRSFRVIRPVQIDLREHLREYLTGHRSSPDVRTLVRGHWKGQRHGPGNSLLKTIWREPHWRGPEAAPMVIRSHQIKVAE